MDNTALEMHEELALLVQWQREEEAKRMRLASAVAQPSLWDRLRDAIQRRPEPALPRR